MSFIAKQHHTLRFVIWNMMKKFLCLPMFACLLICSCHPDNEISNNYFIGVREDIVLTMQQGLSTDGTSLHFVFSSIKADHCEGAGYEHETRTSKNDVSVHLTNVLIPDPCAGSNAKAFQNIPITTQSGIFGLSVDLGDLIQNNGSLIIDEGGFRIVMATSFGIHIPHFEMVRIPEGTVWGYVYHPVKQAAAESILFSILNPHILHSNFDPGFYGHFDVENSGDVAFPLIKDKPGAVPFLVSISTGPSTISLLVDQIKNELPSGTEFRLFTWVGSEF